MNSDSPLRRFLRELERTFWRLRTRHWYRLDKAPLFIETTNGHLEFTVEVARTRGERNHGLMFRGVLAPNTGMLFVYSDENNVNMWMKNTYIPLDILFIGSDGRINHIAADIEAHSSKHISSDYPTYCVLEISAGTSARMGIRLGDLVRSPAMCADPARDT